MGDFAKRGQRIADATDVMIQTTHWLYPLASHGKNRRTTRDRRITYKYKWPAQTGGVIRRGAVREDQAARNQTVTLDSLP